ncbi:MAG: hypothetical protein QOJ00_1119 [Actinomycetota bacterium]|jgi:hypothetical protein
MIRRVVVAAIAATAISVVSATPSVAATRQPDYWTRADTAGPGANAYNTFYAVNDRGDAVGGFSSDVQGGPLIRYAGHPAQRISGSPIDGWFADINNAGVAVGSGFDAGFHYVSYAYDHGLVTELGDGQAQSINDAGTVLLNVYRYDSDAGMDLSAPELRAPNGPRSSLPYAGWTSAAGLDVSNTGWVVGAVVDANNKATAARWSPDGTLQLLATPKGYDEAVALHGNSRGDAVGAALTADRQSIVAVEWRNGEARVLNPPGTFAEARSINDNGTAVGIYVDAAFNVHAVAWQNGTTQYVDDFVTNPTAAVHQLNDISNNGTLASESADQATASVYLPHNGLFVRVTPGQAPVGNATGLDVRIPLENQLLTGHLTAYPGAHSLLDVRFVSPTASLRLPPLP